MVDYPNLTSIQNDSNIATLLALPNASNPFFWTVILGGVFIILSLTMYFREKSLTGRGNLLSSSAVSALACIVIAVFGSLINIFTVETLVPVLVFGLVIIVSWIFSSK